MPQQQPELGSKSPFRLRLGIDIDRFRGVNKENDGGAIGNDEFQDLVNTYITAAGEVVERGGQTRVNTDPMTGCVVGIFDDERPKPSAVQLYFVKNAAGSFPVGSQVTYSPDQDPVFQEHTFPGYPIGIYNDRVLCRNVVGGNTVFKSVIAVPGETTPTTQDEFTATGLTRFYAALQVGTDLYLLLDDNVTPAVKVYKWDGAALTLDDSVSGGAYSALTGVQLVELAGDLYYMPATLDGVTPWVVRRKTGGVWSDFATLTPGWGNANPGLTVYDGALYAMDHATMFGDAAKVLAITAGSIAVAHTITTADGVSLGIMSLASFNGSLYYVYDKYAPYPTLKMYIGQYNGVTWDDAHAAEPFAPDGPMHFDVAFGELIVVRNGLNVTLNESDGTDTTTWAPISDTSGVNSGSSYLGDVVL